jgi:hypothetical protein
VVIITAAVAPLVLTLDGYTDRYGEDDPEELNLMQMHDRERAQAIAEVLEDLFFCRWEDATTPRDEEGLVVELPLAALRELQELAAASEGYTVDDYQVGKVALGARYTQLINHNPEYGVYLPVTFEQSFFLEDYAVGSAPLLLQDLEALAPHLTTRWPDLMAAADTWDVEALAAEAMGPVHVWATLRALCRSAAQMQLPIQLG